MLRSQRKCRSKAAIGKDTSQQKINVSVKQVGCVGICNQVPIMEIIKNGEPHAYYAKIKPEEVKKIISRHFKPINSLDKLKADFYNFFENIVPDNYSDPLTFYSSEKTDTPVYKFLNNQVSIATEHRGQMKPDDLDEYKSNGGFSALLKCINNLSCQDVISIIGTSGLKGRGGAGFPTHIKWQMVKDAKEGTKYVICNGDEGDPGAFMDRMLLESYPFRIIEGMLIAAYATGASEGIFYIRDEYPLAVHRITEAVKICKREGIIGNNVLRSSFSFDIKIFAGAGAFVCGEETALISSIEGKTGTAC